MNNRNTISRAFLAFAIFALFCAGIFAPRVDKVAAAPLAQATSCYGSTITYWDFTGSTINPAQGFGILTFGGGLIGPSYLTGELSTDTPAVSFSGWSSILTANEYIEFQVDTSGRTSISLSFKSRISSTGPATFELYYSIDNGTSFTPLGTSFGSDTGGDWDVQTIDFSSITTLNDNPGSIFRLYGYSASATGTWRIDNVSFVGNCIIPGPTFTFTPTNTYTITNTPTNTGTPTDTGTPTRTGTIATSTRTSTPTRTATPTATALPNLTVLINEVAWMGTTASTGDEWIELYNPSVTTTIDLTGWQLKTTDESPEIIWSPSDNVLIPPGGYYLLERSNDNTVLDVPANKTYPGELVNGGEVLRLFNNSGVLVDVANSNGGGWPAGSETNRRTMERMGVIQDSDAAWVTNNGIDRNGVDELSNPINGTPGQPNWGVTVTLTASRTPTKTRTPTATRTITRTPTPRSTATPIPLGRPVINEFLVRPGFDWNQDGNVDVFDEFIEIKNIGPVDINMNGWKLDDEANLGSNPFTITDLTLKPGERIVFYGLETNILLSDGGDTVRLLNPSNRVYDSYTYKIAKVEDKSICRLVDGNGSWYEDCTPTPNFTNSRDGDVPSMPDGSGFESPVCNLPDTLPEAFFIAECRGYGANLWSAIYWDSRGWDGDRFVPENMSKWETFVE